jgi:hypothetical protein
MESKMDIETEGFKFVMEGGLRIGSAQDVPNFGGKPGLLAMLGTGQDRYPVGIFADEESAAAAVREEYAAVRRQGAPETLRLVRPAGRRSPQMLRRPGDPRTTRTKFLIPIAVAALPAGYLFFGDSNPPVNVAVVPQVTTDRLSAEFALLQEAKARLFNATDITIESRIEQTTDSKVESPIETKVQPAPFQQTVPLDIKPTDNGLEARPPPQKERRSLTSSQDGSTCFPSAWAVQRNYPKGRPSWTFRTPGQRRATKCWYAATPTAAKDRRSEMRREETVQTTEKVEAPVLFGLQY